MAYQVTKNVCAVLIRHTKRPTTLLNIYFILQNKHHSLQLHVPKETHAFNCSFWKKTFFRVQKSYSRTKLPSQVFWSRPNSNSPYEGLDYPGERELITCWPAPGSFGPQPLKHVVTDVTNRYRLRPITQNQKSTNDIFFSGYHTWAIVRQISVFNLGTRLCCGVTAITRTCSTVGASDILLTLNYNIQYLELKQLKTIQIDCLSDGTWVTNLLSFHVTSILCTCNMIPLDTSSLYACSWKVWWGFCKISPFSWTSYRAKDDQHGACLRGSYLCWKTGWTIFQRFLLSPTSLQTRSIFF